MTAFETVGVNRQFDARNIYEADKELINLCVNISKQKERKINYETQPIQKITYSESTWITFHCNLSSIAHYG